MQATMTAYQAAEKMETAFCNREFANVSEIIGADWSAGRNFSTAAAYQRAAYERADEIYGALPWRFERCEGEEA